MRLRLVLLVFSGLLLTSGAASGQSFNSLIVSEIMADPSPSVGLPEVEYLEVYNRTEQPIVLRNWQWEIGSRTGVFPPDTLQAGQYALLISRTRIADMQRFGKVLGLTSFILPNEGAVISIRDAAGHLVFSLEYSDRWYPTTTLRNGGYALEMMDTDYPCGGLENWAVSVERSGGTPGRANSVRRPNPDLIAPRLLRVEVTDPQQLTAVFSEKIIPEAARIPQHWTLEGGLRLQEIEPIEPGLQRVALRLTNAIEEGKLYRLKVTNMQDCAGNSLTEAEVAFGLPRPVAPGDVVLNELLFNPPTGGVDFVELYNTTASVISLKGWALGNISQGQPANWRTLTTDDYLLLPYDYVVLTTRPDWIRDYYPEAPERTLLAMPSLPSYPNAQGGVVIREAAGLLMDRFDYNERDHFTLFSGRRGVSLERVRADFPTNQPTNWHSAAATAGYATPGYQNSQAGREAPPVPFVVEPVAFSPDGDGQDDYTQIKYLLGSPGVVATLHIYDAGGRLVKTLLSNQLIGTSGAVTWDGTDLQGRPVPTGNYVVWIETFTTQGSTEHYKLRVVVARR